MYNLLVPHPPASVPAFASQSVSRPGISGDTLLRAGVRHVTAYEANNLMGRNLPGVIIPYFDIMGHPLMIEGKQFVRLRPDNPPKDQKYLSPKGSGCQLYVPPDLLSRLQPGCALIIVEGEFKSLALVEAGYPAVGIGGITSSCPHGDLLPALADLIAHFQPARIAFVGDSDTCLIPDFTKEAVKLSSKIKVPVILPRIPLAAPGKAPDDLRESWKEHFAPLWDGIMSNHEVISKGDTASSLAVRILRRESNHLENLKGLDLEKAQERIINIALNIHDDEVSFAAIEEIAVRYLSFKPHSFRPVVKARADLKNLESATGAISPQSQARSGDKLMILPSGDLSITDAAIDIFSEIGQRRGLYSRGGRVHEIGNQCGTTILSPINAAQFCSRIEMYGQVMAKRADSDSNGSFRLKKTRCSEEIADKLLQSLAAREYLPNIRVLSPCPVLANLGGKCTVLESGWYDFNGGIFVASGKVQMGIEINEARHALLEILSDFDFLTPGDRSRAFAALIVPALRMGGWLNERAPIDVAEADVSQAGKGFRHKLTAAIYNQSPRIIAQKKGGVGGFDESLSQALIEGAGFVLVDNIRGKIDSPFFESVMTAPGGVPCRVPHRGEIIVDPSFVNFQLSSNGAEMTSDLANRSSVIRIRKRPEEFKFRKYPEGNVFDHVCANRGYYLGCVFACIQKWVELSKPRVPGQNHDFREWAAVLSAFTTIFSGGQLLAGHSEARARVADPKLSWLRLLCIAMRDAEKTEAWCAAEGAEFAIEHGLLPPNVGPDIDKEGISKVIGVIMARVFKDANEVEMDGFRLKRSEKQSTTAAKMLKTYQLL